MNETDAQNQTAEHKDERKQHFQRLKNWSKEYLRPAWKDTKKAARTGKFWFELLALIVLGVYTTFAGCQTRIANRTLKEIHKGGDLQRRVSLAVYGADVVLSTVFLRHEKETKQLWAIMKIQNFGKTNAESVRIAANLDFVVPKHRDFAPTDFGIPSSPTILPATATEDHALYSSTKKIFPDSGAANVYVWGEISYESLGIVVRPVKFCRYALAKTALETTEDYYDFKSCD